MVVDELDLLLVVLEGVSDELFLVPVEAVEVAGVENHVGNLCPLEIEEAASVLYGRDLVCDLSLGVTVKLLGEVFKESSGVE